MNRMGLRSKYSRRYKVTTDSTHNNLDLFDRKLIGWSMSDNMSASNTVIPAIRMANRNRAFTDGMIFHSDRGVQYACKHTANILNAMNVQQSMSRKGNCWDNKGFTAPSSLQENRCVCGFLNISNRGIIIKEDSRH